MLIFAVPLGFLLAALPLCVDIILGQVLTTRSLMAADAGLDS